MNNFSYFYFIGANIQRHYDVTLNPKINNFVWEWTDKTPVYIL